MLVLVAFAAFFALIALYETARAEHWKRRAENPWDSAWREFARRQGIK